MDSTVTLSFPNSYSQIWPYGSDDKGILSALMYNLQPSRGGQFCFVLPPPHAKTLADRSWTKEGVKHFISEFGRVPAHRHPSYYWVNELLRRKETIPIKCSGSKIQKSRAHLCEVLSQKISNCNPPGSDGSLVSFCGYMLSPQEWMLVIGKITIRPYLCNAVYL